MNRKLASIIVNFGAAGALMLWLPWPLLWRWLVAVSIITVLALARDKFAAKLKFHRVPELTIHLLAFAGGSLALLLGRMVLQHKISKPSFNRVLFLVVVVQLGAVGLIMYYHATLTRLIWLAKFVI